MQITFKHINDNFRTITSVDQFETISAKEHYLRFGFVDNHTEIILNRFSNEIPITPSDWGGHPSMFVVRANGNWQKQIIYVNMSEALILSERIKQHLDENLLPTDVTDVSNVILLHELGHYLDNKRNDNFIVRFHKACSEGMLGNFEQNIISKQNEVRAWEIAHELLLEFNLQINKELFFAMMKEALLSHGVSQIIIDESMEKLNEQNK